MQLCLNNKSSEIEQKFGFWEFLYPEIRITSESTKEKSYNEFMNETLCSKKTALRPILKLLKD